MNIDILRNISLFSAIKESDLEKLIAGNHIYRKHYMKGATVHNANETCRTLDIVLSGSLVAYSLSTNGSATTMFEFSQGSVIGANLLFGENHSYPLTIYCLTDCQIIHIDINAVLEFLHDYNFTLHYIKSISQNSQGINQKIAMFTQRTLRENIMDYFKQQTIIQKSSVILLPMSKRQLADYLGVQRPSLFRELKKLKEEGIIEINNRTIAIKNKY
ncbi:helix-turn-helix domain-containing protein [Lactonifactor sp. BIOML-A3]|uniref:Crp/Fnr family transcriptional regulator n=1 Tax=unclassified Lactonifactor TaxID=2636670 RepID=UPI0012B13DF6|nr:MULTISPECIES: Crp/Fnr family transcriptional regulator [unclassified Lactonifactor]MSA03436.1 helix-turn-helix domain-containing protein [Lactonifactor sp. BIOML-A5]MSA09785.1 helix-turn-helix domain-containing protein [Lactonifactor sp. BIOML-A4]MSA14327.1 helix-turn-helix domain-containing protein [Lactonifactor sp. BIOML-A3]MSA18790.1 helix-turn-helix domain-containing protein [Lactonifactor sp. BIOML-A2]MSA39572.1 helix-turn-helix domain-containing protein [Lactonifactor sp. BIOML-A1]